MSNDLNPSTENDDKVIPWRVQLKLPEWVIKRILNDAADESRHYTAIINRILKERYAHDR